MISKCVHDAFTGVCLSRVMVLLFDFLSVCLSIRLPVCCFLSCSFICLLWRINIYIVEH